MMKNRPFAPLILLFVTLPLVLDGIPPMTVILAEVQRATDGALPVIAGLFALLGVAVLMHRSRRGDLDI